MKLKPKNLGVCKEAAKPDTEGRLAEAKKKNHYSREDKRQGMCQKRQVQIDCGGGGVVEKSAG